MPTAFTSWFSAAFALIESTIGPKRKKKIRIKSVLIILASRLCAILNTDTDSALYQILQERVQRLDSSTMINTDEGSWSIEQAEAWQEFESLEAGFVTDGTVKNIEDFPNDTALAALSNDLQSALTAAGI